MRTIPIIAALLLVAAPVASLASQTAPKTTTSDQRWILELDRAPDEALVAQIEATGVQVVFQHGPPLDILAVTGTPEEVQAASQHEAVEHVAIDHQVRPMATPNDELFWEQWAPHAIDARQAWEVSHIVAEDQRASNGTLDGPAPAFGTPPDPPEACAITPETAPTPDLGIQKAARRDPCVVVAVIDTGVDMAHPDLEGRAWGAMLDYTTDVENGYEHADNYGHGTHVAGLVAATAGNEEGIASAGGVASTYLQPVRGLTAGGWGYSSWIATAIVEAVDHGADIVSMSLGSDYPSNLYEQAIEYATARGGLVIASTGNAWGDHVGYPAAYPGVLAVSATENVGEDQELAIFSSTGSPVDIAAPGHHTISTLPTYPDYTIRSYYTDGNGWGWTFVGSELYGTLSGTSMAAPIVAGSAALATAVLASDTCQGWDSCEAWRSPTPGIDTSPPQAAAALLQATATDLGADGWDPAYGWGQVDIGDALTRLQKGAGPLQGLPAPNDAPVAQAGEDEGGLGYRALAGTGTGPIQATVSYRHGAQPFYHGWTSEAVDHSLRLAPGLAWALANAPGDQAPVRPGGTAVLYGTAETRSERYTDLRCEFVRIDAWSDAGPVAGSVAPAACLLWGDGAEIQAFVATSNQAVGQGLATVCHTPGVQTSLWLQACDPGATPWETEALVVAGQHIEQACLEVAAWAAGHSIGLALPAGADCDDVLPYEILGPAKDINATTGEALTLASYLEGQVRNDVIANGFDTAQTLGDLLPDVSQEGTP